MSWISSKAINKALIVFANIFTVNAHHTQPDNGTSRGASRGGDLCLLTYESTFIGSAAVSNFVARIAKL